MQIWRKKTAWAMLLGLLILCAGYSCAPAGAEEAPAYSKAREIFAAKCLACHGNDPQDLKGEYDLRSRAAAIKGGESGEAAIVPGQPEQSPLYRAVTWEDDSLQMPPKENDRLSAEQVALIRRWIAAGAKWDEPAATTVKTGDAWSSGPDGIRIVTSGGRSPAWDNRTYEPDAIWAYRPLRTVGNALRGVPLFATRTNFVPC
jgi:mono/diheme cytochrome c family protein